MPWAPNDADSHTQSANSPKLKRMWAHIADKELAEGKDDGTAVKIANGAVAKQAAKKSVKKSASERLIRIAKSFDVGDEEEEKGIGNEVVPSKILTVRAHARINQNKKQITPVSAFKKRKFDV
jgi:hypothetical protein